MANKLAGQKRYRALPELTERQLTPQQAETISSVIRSAVGGLIGVALTGIYSLVIVALVIAAILKPEQAAQFLGTAVTLAGPAIGAVLAHFLTRNPRER